MVIENKVYKDKKIDTLYFDRPVQVKFQHKHCPNKKIFGYGIAYCDEIIEFKNGIIISFDEITYIEILPWKSILFKY